MSIEITLTQEKETKNTVKFEEDENDLGHLVIRSLYINKKEHKDIGAPKKITVTIDAA